MQQLSPASEEELCDALVSASRAGVVIALGGAFSKNGCTRPLPTPETVISVSNMRRVLQYEPRDLTISVEAGLPWAGLSALLAERRQMIPLDPPYFERATVGGVVAANAAGPRRRLHGSARDLVIGMTFAKLDGKLVKSGGMVVKNVAGYDMAKLMIGSWGTLAAVTVVNFKLSPLPPETRTFVMQFNTAAECCAARDRIIGGVLQPSAIDILNPAAAAWVGLEGFCLLIQAGGSPAVLARTARELEGARQLDGNGERLLWALVREFTPEFVGRHVGAQVARVSGVLSDVAAVLASYAGPVVARAASGISYLHFFNAAEAREWTSRPETAAWRYVFEYGEPGWNGAFGSGYDMMKAVKDLFDPNRLLNPGRLYGRL